MESNQLSRPGPGVVDGGTIGWMSRRYVRLFSNVFMLIHVVIIIVAIKSFMLLDNYPW